LAQPEWRLELIAILAVALAWQLARAWRDKGYRLHPALLAVAIAPFAWFEVFANHSIVHAWFTHRLLAPTLFLLLLAATRLRSRPRHSRPAE
jgi:hypothetical protein